MLIVASHSQAESLQLYADFCAKHEDAMVLLRQYEVSRIDWEAYQNNCAMQVAMRFPASALNIGARLRIRDYAIKPIQRICRYPMMLIALEKLVNEGSEGEAEAARAVKKATEAVKDAADEVNAAKAQMEIERKSALVARRLEIPQVRWPEHLFLTETKVPSLCTVYPTHLPFRPRLCTPCRRTLPRQIPFSGECANQSLLPRIFPLHNTSRTSQSKKSGLLRAKTLATSPRI